MPLCRQSSHPAHRPLRTYACPFWPVHHQIHDLAGTRGTAVATLPLEWHRSHAAMAFRLNQRPSALGAASRRCRLPAASHFGSSRRPNAVGMAAVAPAAPDLGADSYCCLVRAGARRGGARRGCRGDCAAHSGAFVPAADFSTRTPPLAPEPGPRALLPEERRGPHGGRLHHRATQRVQPRMHGSGCACAVHGGGPRGPSHAAARRPRAVGWSPRSAASSRAAAPPPATPPRPPRAPQAQSARGAHRNTTCHPLNPRAPGGRTSFKLAAGARLADAAARDKAALPPAFGPGLWCDKWEERLGAAARTWLRPHAQDNLMWAAGRAALAARRVPRTRGREGGARGPGRGLRAHEHAQGGNCLCPPSRLPRAPAAVGPNQHPFPLLTHPHQCPPPP